MITKELIKQARQTDLAEYLLKRGEPLKRDRNGRYRHLEHDSLVFTKNAFYWNSRSEKGNAIDFLMLYYQMDFQTALAELTNTDLSIKKEPAPVAKREQVPVSIDFVLPQINKDKRRTFAYLIKTRLIDTSIVQKLAKENLLMQDQRGNAVFPWFDENRQVVGSELNGTLDKIRFKGISPGSKYGWGYNIRIGSPEALYAFESAIDLLSFWSLHKGLKNVLLVSMGGLKEEVLKGFLERSTSLSDVFLCVDNDDAGKRFIEAVQSKINATPDLPPLGKDWNDYLKTKKDQNLI